MPVTVETVHGHPRPLHRPLRPRASTERGGRIAADLFFGPFIVAAVIYFALPSFPLRPFLPALVPVSLFAALIWLTLVARQRVAINKAGLGLVLIYAAFSTVSMLGTEHVDFFSIRKILLPLSALTIAVFYYETSTRSVIRFFAIVFLMAIVFGGKDVLDTFSGSGPLILSSAASNESAFGVVFGAASVWMAAKGKLRWSLLLFVASIILFKRNAILNAALCIFLLLALRSWLSPMATQWCIRKLSLLAWFLFAILSFRLVDVFEYVSLERLSGVSAESLSVGRYYVYLLVERELANSTIWEWLFGHGAGAVERLIFQSNQVNALITLTHNEYMSLHFDFGVIGSLFILFSVYRLGKAEVSSSILILFFFNMILVENIFFISFNLMIFLFLVCARTSTTNAG